MSIERSAAIINASCARAMIRLEAMKAANLLHPEPPPYTPEHMKSIIDEENIGWNAVIETLNQGERG